jgi:hypothetical protein
MSALEGGHLTPELTGRADNAGTDKLTMKDELTALRLNELLGVASLKKPRYFLQ